MTWDFMNSPSDTAVKKPKRMPEVMYDRDIRHYKLAVYWTLHSTPGRPPARYGTITQIDAIAQYYRVLGQPRRFDVFYSSIRNCWETCITWCQNQGFVLENPKKGWPDATVPEEYAEELLDFGLMKTEQEQWNILNRWRCCEDTAEQWREADRLRDMEHEEETDEQPSLAYDSHPTQDAAPAPHVEAPAEPDRDENVAEELTIKNSQKKEDCHRMLSAACGALLIIHAYL